MIRLTLYRHLLKVAHAYDRQPALKALLQLYPRRVYNHDHLRWDELSQDDLADILEPGDDESGSDTTTTSQPSGSSGVPRGYIEPDPALLQYANELTQGGDYYRPTRSIVEVLHRAARKNVASFDVLRVGLACLRSLNYHLHAQEALLPQPLYPPFPHRITVQDKVTKGCFLVAHPRQLGYFAHSVLLVLDCSSEGAVGFVVNQPLRAPYVFQGGPVNRRKWFPIERHDVAGGGGGGGDVEESEKLPLGTSSLKPEDGPSGSSGSSSKQKPQELTQGVYLLRDSIHVGTVDEDNAGKFVLLAGYAEWGPGQLEGEVEQNAWFVVTCDNPAELTFAAAAAAAAAASSNPKSKRHSSSPDEPPPPPSPPPPSEPPQQQQSQQYPYRLWVQVLAAMGGEYRDFARLPPQLPSPPPTSSTSSSSEKSDDSDDKGQ